MAEVAAGAGEERLRGRAVHVDVLGVREDELGEAERVLLARLLAHEELPGDHLVEVLRAWRQGRGVLVAARHDLHVLALEVGGVAARLRHDLRADDARGRAPVRPEDHVLHLVDEDRRLVVERLADHHVHPQRLVRPARGRRPRAGTAATFTKTCGSLRVSGSQRTRSRASSIWRTRCASGDVQRLDRAGADDAVGLEGVAALEALDRVHERPAVDGASPSGAGSGRRARPREGRRRRAAARARAGSAGPRACPARPSSASRRAPAPASGSPAAASAR